MDIFWTPAFPTMDSFAEQNMLYREPDALATLSLAKAPGDLLGDATIRRALHNVFVVRSPVSSNIVIRNGQIEQADSRFRDTLQLFAPASPLRREYIRMRLAHQLIFFSPMPVIAIITGAYFHQTEIQSKFMFTPRSFDISRILFPIEAAFEFSPAVNQFQFREGDPLYYVRFETSEPIRLRRFRLSPELVDVIKGCVNFGHFRPQSSLESMYQAFVGADFTERVSKLVMKSLPDGDQK